jgi:hypothetical protein
MFRRRTGHGWFQEHEGKVMGKETITKGKYHNGRQKCTRKIISKQVAYSKSDSRHL